VSQDSVIAADGLVDGNGGRVIAWADNATEFYGSASVRGGSNAGNGGFVEVSGKENLAFDGTADLSAENGSFGTLLLDPTNITIVAGATGDGTDDGQLNDGEILATDLGDTLVISRGKLESLTGNIILEATNDITIADGVSLNFVPGGSITFKADAGASDGVGAFAMDQTQSITAPGRNLTISGASITAGNINPANQTSLHATAGGIAVGNINAGNLDLTSVGDISAGRLYSTGAVNLSASAGNITVETIESTAFDFTSLGINITASGLFQATGIISNVGRNADAGVVPTLDIDAPENLDIKQFLQDQGVLDANGEIVETANRVISGRNIVSVNNGVRTITEDLSELPISILSRNSNAQINIQHGGAPLDTDNNSITVSGSGDTQFVVGPQPTRLSPSEFEIITILSSGGSSSVGIKYQQFSPLTPSSGNFPSTVSGTAGAIIVGKGTNLVLAASLQNRPFISNTNTDTNIGTNTGTEPGIKTGTNTDPGIKTDTNVVTDTVNNIATNTTTDTAINTSTNIDTDTVSNVGTNTGTDTGSNTSTNTGTDTGAVTDTDTANVDAGTDGVEIAARTLDQQDEQSRQRVRGGQSASNCSRREERRQRAADETEESDRSTQDNDNNEDCEELKPRQPGNSGSPLLRIELETPAETDTQRERSSLPQPSQPELLTERMWATPRR
jgi:hypothetical protein